MILSLISILSISCSEKKSEIKIEKVLLFGDSLMSGYGLPEDDHLSVVLEKKLKSEGYEIQIFNGSISGDTSSDGLEPTNGLSYKKKFDIIYPDLSKKFELELIPFLLIGVALNPSLNQNDGIHPNEKGVLIISETIKKSITNYSKK